MWIGRRLCAGALCVITGLYSASSSGSPQWRLAPFQPVVFASEGGDEAERIRRRAVEDFELRKKEYLPRFESRTGALGEELDADLIGRRNDIERLIRSIQDRICAFVEAAEFEASPEDPARFVEDPHERGITRVLQNGKVFEKAGVNVSVIHNSKLPPAAVKAMRGSPSGNPELVEIAEKKGGLPFFVCGVSVVLHPHNPHAPTVHCNYRVFEIDIKGENSQEPIEWWVGGGADLTPAYLYENDAIHFHKTHAKVCDKYDPSWYDKFKRWCDEYFRIRHRQESRGIGGIFFDDLSSKSRQELFGFLSDCGEAFCDAYFPILASRMNQSYTKDQKIWQQIRRGRYVEFNLIWDRGTKFGLSAPNARIESILMSLPLTARWEYMMIPEQGSPEDQLLKVLKEPRNWLGRTATN